MHVIFLYFNTYIFHLKEAALKFKYFLQFAQRM